MSATVNAMDFSPQTMGKGRPERPLYVSLPPARQIHDVVGGERFRTLKNAEIMKETNLKKRLRLDFGLEPGDAAKRCLDRIREAKGYPLSREIAKKTGNPPERPAVLQQLTTTAQSVREYRPIPASCG